MKSLTVNNQVFTFEADDDTPLLWVIREKVGLQGTKFGCGAGVCGACTVHVDGVATRSCITPVMAVAGKNITTIEGLSEDASHPLQEAWVEDDVPQCGYCQSGQLMTAAALLENNSNPSEQEINDAMNVICRCGSHQRIRKGVQKAAAKMSK